MRTLQKRNRRRRGFAMITALWLVVAIAVVTLQFSLEAKERRIIGVNAAERGFSRAADIGAFSMTVARLDQALRAAPTGRAAASMATMRSADPWLGADSIFSGTITVDSMDVTVEAHDLGAKVNINTLSEDELRTFFGFVTRDFPLSDQLAQSIMDWRDSDDIPRTNGGESDDYIKAGLMILPANGPFREVDDLMNVRGMTRDVLEEIRPYITTRGGSVINLNSAPEPVLRVLPGITDQMVSTILALRGNGQRITSVQQVLGAMQGSRAQTPGQAAAGAALTNRLASRAGVNTLEIELTLTSRRGPQAQPVKLLAIVRRGAYNGSPVSTITWKPF